MHHCKRKGCNGVAPNRIHSDDGSIVTKTTLKNSSSGIMFQSFIHDAALGLSPDMPMMVEHLLESVIEIYSQDLMQDFLSELTHYLPIGVTLPEPPERGDLDIELIRQSQYFYS